MDARLRSHYREINGQYAGECSQDDLDEFIFTSESVGEGHPGGISFKIVMLICIASF